MSAPIPIGVRIVGGTVMLAGTYAFGAFAIPILRRNYKRATQGIAARGIVTGSQLRHGIGAVHYSYYPEVEFETQSGEKVTFVHSSAPTHNRNWDAKLRFYIFPMIRKMRTYHRSSRPGCFLYFSCLAQRVF